MAFVKKTWTDRVAEFINRRLLTKEDGSTELVTVARSEGTVSTEGDGFTAANMNDLEQRIADEFNAQNDNFANQISELNNALPFKEFQTGTVKTNSVAGDTWSSTDVVFETEFSEVPKVLATMFDTSANTGHCYIKAISKTGFTVKTMGTGYSTAHAHTVNWIAFV